jgi:hypothetical protein
LVTIVDRGGHAGLTAVDARGGSDALALRRYGALVLDTWLWYAARILLEEVDGSGCKKLAANTCHKVMVKPY